MPTFRYTARNSAGKRVEGTVDAINRREALMHIEGLGQVPISVLEGGGPAPAKRKAGSKGRKAAAPKAPRPAGPRARARGRGFSLLRTGPRMRTRELLTFTTELHDLLVSGMTLGSALNALANRQTGKPSDLIVIDLRDEIVRGSSLSDAMARHPRTFSNLYVSMIKAGEAAGAMTDVLDRLVQHFERVQDTREKVTMALVYPAIVLLMGAATLVFSMVYVIPKFKVVFEQLGASLPLPTRILITSSEWMARYGWLLAIAIVILLVVINRAIQTESGRLVWDKLLLRVPLLKGVVASSIYANFARTLGTLLLNGVPVLEALRIVENTTGNALIGAEIRKARDRVTDGTTISGPLAAGKVMPRMMTDMLSIGEQTGDMSGSLSHIAIRYEHELDRHVKIFTTALEPILIVVIAVLVGFVAISILMAVGAV